MESGQYKESRIIPSIIDKILSLISIIGALVFIISITIAFFAHLFTKGPDLSGMDFLSRIGFFLTLAGSAIFIVTTLLRGFLKFGAIFLKDNLYSFIVWLVGASLTAGWLNVILYHGSNLNPKTSFLDPQIEALLIGIGVSGLLTSLLLLYLGVYGLLIAEERERQRGFTDSILTLSAKEKIIASLLLVVLIGLLIPTLNIQNTELIYMGIFFIFGGSIIMLFAAIFWAYLKGGIGFSKYAIKKAAVLLTGISLTTGIVLGMPMLVDLGYANLGYLFSILGFLLIIGGNIIIWAWPGYLIEGYLFSWGGVDKWMLIRFLRDRYDINWVETAKIEKINNDKTIRVFTEKNSLYLRLNDEKTMVNLEIDDGRTDKFIVKLENNNIYG